MRIRRRVADALPHAQAASSFRTRSPPAPPPPPSAPPRRCAPCLEANEEPPACEADRSTYGATTDGHRLPSHDRNRQEEVKEEKGRAAENEKREEEDGTSEHEHGRPVHVVCSYLRGATAKGEEDERRAEVDEEKREDSGRVKDEEKKTVRICKKGDGKGWQCKTAAQPGYSLCQYHLDKLRSYSCHSQKKKPRAATSLPGKPAAAGTHRARAPSQQQQQKRTEERVVSTRLGASDSFYYYSGFGPRWGKRRGNRPADGVKTPGSGASDVVPPLEYVGAAAVAGGGEEEAELVVVVEEEEEEEEDYDCDGESRDGKPPKSRRLSSLI